MRPTVDSSSLVTPSFAALVAVVATCILMLAFEGDASAQSGPSLSFKVGPSGDCVSVDEGDEVEVALVISDVTNLQAWEATITHNFDVIQIIEKDVRLFLAQDGGSLIEAVEPLPDNNGRHLLSIGGDGAVAVSGSGTLAIITFQAVGAGISVIDIPQNDFDGDGDTDEGAILTENGGAKISDNNGDHFFDGSVQSAVIAVEESCDSPTEEPTDPPTPGPSMTATPAGDGAGSRASGDTGAPDSGHRASPQPTAAGDVIPPSKDPDKDPNAGGDVPGDGDDAGSSFPMWLMAVPLAGGLGLVVAVAFFSLRGSRGRPRL